MRASARPALSPPVPTASTRDLSGTTSERSGSSARRRCSTAAPTATPTRRPGTLSSRSRASSCPEPSARRLETLSALLVLLGALEHPHEEDREEHDEHDRLLEHHQDAPQVEVR